MYNYIWYFIIYAFLGWCCEVIFAAIKHGKFVNRGFCNGPVCPIYGFGVVIVALLLNPIKHNILVLYFGSVLLTSALELVTGFLMEKLLKNRWWDYSDNKFNIGGYVCLSFSLIWGVACVLIVDLVHPLFVALVTTVPIIIGLPIALVLLGVIIADAVYTIVCVNKFNKKLKQMDEFVTAMHKISDAIGENVAENAIALKQNSEKLKVQSEKALQEIQIKNEKALKELQLKKEELLNKNRAIQSRLVNAFPKLQPKHYSESFEEFKKYISKYKKTKNN